MEMARLSSLLVMEVQLSHPFILVSSVLSKLNTGNVSMITDPDGFSNLFFF